MKYREAIIVQMKENNGIIRTKDIEIRGINREYISKLYKEGIINKIDRGIYSLKGTIIDEYYIYQLKHPEVVFSHDSALYFHDMTEKTPDKIFVTVPQGYYDKKKPDNIQFYYCKKELINLGVIETKTTSGNTIRVYDKERTICDILKKKKNIDPEQWAKTIRNYFFHSDVDYQKLIYYAKKMGVYKMIESYIVISI